MMKYGVDNFQEKQIYPYQVSHMLISAELTKSRKS